MAQRKEAREQVDVAVVGAGAAGLACARALLDRGLSVRVLEARGRIGGRACTTRFEGLDVPIELGAEFIHGEAKTTVARADDLGLAYCDAYEGHMRTRGQGKADDPTDYWDRMEALFGKLDPARKPDRPVAAFLEAQKSSADLETRKLAAAFVEGFHAADLNLIGERGLALAEQVSDGPSITRAARLLGGYQSLIDGYLHGLAGASEVVRLNCVVKEIAWKKGEVRVTAHSRAGFPLQTFHAARAVITVPLGVLQAPPGATAAIALDPAPPGLASALVSVHMGHAMRLVFRFRSRFWEELAPPEAEGKVGYLHAGPELDFPTWWTSMPVRAPILTAWQGGPRAARLSLLPEGDRVKCALETLGKLLGCGRKKIERELQGWATHDWSQDPYSLGAYSYVGVDGAEGASRLTRPVADTLYFAGEACALDTTRGTVEGALQSGLRAAKQILKVPRA